MVPTVKGLFQVSVIAVALLCWFYYEDYKIDRLKRDIVESLPAHLSELNIKLLDLMNHNVDILAANNELKKNLKKLKKDIYEMKVDILAENKELEDSLRSNMETLKGEMYEIKIQLSELINNHMHMLTENRVFKDDLSKVSEDLVKQINYLTIFLIDSEVKTSDAVAEIKEKVDVNADNSGMKKKLQLLAQITCTITGYAHRGIEGGCIIIEKLLFGLIP